LLRKGVDGGDTALALEYGASLKDWLFAQKYGSPYLNGSAVLLE